MKELISSLSNVKYTSTDSYLSVSSTVIFLCLILSGSPRLYEKKSAKISVLTEID